MRSRRLVAESLRDVPAPVATALPPERSIDGTTLAAVVAAMRAPDLATDPPPPFLRAHQQTPWRRCLATLRGWDAALLAEPVGHGKTWIALALARACGGEAVVIGPATLAGQWQRTAERTGVRIRFHSHERLSRGHEPRGRGLVIVDEAHWLRRSGTRRATTLAPWLLGRRTLLLTATPIINRRRDLLDLLSLVVPDHALELDGIPSIAGLADATDPPDALRRLVIRSGADASPVLRTRRRALATSPAEAARGDRVLAALARLRLGAMPSVRRLVALVLLDAAASSDAAWRSALSRYRGLLLHARDAGGIGRAALRQFIGADLEQTVLWPMLPTPEAGDGLLPISDLAVVDDLLSAPPDDRGWLDEVVSLVADGRPSICFCRHRATARCLVERLGEQVAWCTGREAGIGRHQIPREVVLAAFGPERSRWRARRALPTILVATEVLAEGLDLQGASRVVHVDLPWQPARLAQRTGRILRPGQLSPDVMVVTRRPVQALDQQLQRLATLARKGRLAERWLGHLECRVELPGAALLGRYLWIATSGGDDPVTGWVELQRGGRTGVRCVELAPPASGQDRHQLAGELAWRALAATSAARRGHPELVARLLALARRASRHRDRRQLACLDRLLAIASRDGPRGHRILLDRLATLPDEALAATVVATVAAEPPITVRRLAICLPPGTLPGYLVPCRRPALSCSTSTGRSSTRSTSSSTAISTPSVPTDSPNSRAKS